MKGRAVTIVALCAFATFLLAPLAARVGVLPHLPAVAGFALAALVSFGCFVVVAVRIVRRKHPLEWATAITFLVAAIPIATLATVYSQAAGMPPIHNIATSRDMPSCIEAPERRPQGSNPLQATEKDYQAQLDAYPEIRPLETQYPADLAYRRAAVAARNLGWEIYLEDPENMRIEALETTFWFGFKDDVCIVVRPLSDVHSRIDLRSVSRVGRGDLGANAERIRAFRRTFESL